MKKSKPINAQKLQKDTFVTLNAKGAAINAKVGEWVVTWEDGEKSIYTDAAFKKDFTIVETT